MRSACGSLTIAARVSAPTRWPAPASDDWVRNGDETDVDCGGVSSVRDGQAAQKAAPASAVCAPTAARRPLVLTACKMVTRPTWVRQQAPAPTAAPALCRRLRQPICRNGQGAAATCIDEVRNGDETDVDREAAGLPGRWRLRRQPTAPWRMHRRCSPGRPAAMAANGDETDVDCGGPRPACADGAGCEGATDCGSSVARTESAPSLRAMTAYKTATRPASTAAARRRLRRRRRLCSAPTA